jgi:molecular chaperone GrpE
MKMTKKKGEPKENAEMQQLKEKNTDLLKTVQMLQAEFENYKKRVDRDRQSHADMSNKSLILNILPVIDNFEMALKSEEHKSQSRFFERY